MKNLFLSIALVSSLSACGFTPQGDLVREVIREKGAQAYDEGLNNSFWAVCEAASVGSIKRRFGTSPELMNAYNTLCRAQGADFNLLPTK